MSQIKKIAIAVVEDNGRFLVGPRCSDDPLNGLNEFPGGKVEPGETVVAAAIRECNEEAGIEVHAVGLYPMTIHHYDHVSVELNFVACVPVGASELQNEFRWIERELLAEYAFPEGNAEILATLANQITPTPLF
ncbi:MAG: NUDIX domain-containing protein [Pirellulales bacterium]|nr:NUDIX domain-containing protein [Pirellulales bacterium]